MLTAAHGPRQREAGEPTEAEYTYRTVQLSGSTSKYRPDFLIRLGSGDMLVLEVKGRERDRDRTKRRFLDEWVAAVNAHGGFGRWRWAVSRKPSDVHDVLAAANDRIPDVGSVSVG